jgi:formate C-acetyltransferase
MINERIEFLKQDVMTRTCVFETGHNSHHGSWVKDQNVWARDVALKRARQKTGSWVQLKAAILKELTNTSKIAIYPQWTLVGEHLGECAFASLKEDAWIKEYLPQLSDYGLSEKDLSLVRENVEWFHTYDKTTEAGEASFDKTHEQNNGFGLSIYLARGWMENHSVRDYAKLIRIGYGGIKAEIKQLLDKTPIDAPDFVEKENFWKAGITVCEAGINLGKKYSELAAGMATSSKLPEEKTRLKNMAELCAKVPENGAESFFEAVQILWFGHILTCGEDGINANSLGRLDQILYPYYKKDIENGKISRDEVFGIMCELACKLYLDYDVQAITLGGSDSNGNDCTNELTYIILEATEALGFIRDIAVRVHGKSPESLMKLCARMIAKGGGIPFLFNDECFIPALTSHGIKPDDACDYTPIGCIELTIPGKANPHAVSSWFNSTKCLELALFNGIDPLTGERIGVETGDFKKFKSYDEFFNAYCKQVEYFVPRMIYHTNRGELMQREFGPLPCWSILTDDCIKRGKDITNGGAVYNYHSICFLGTANTADSLYALKKLVFEEKKIKPEELLHSLNNNFEGTENLRQMLLHDAAKYGNDVDEVDKIAVEVDNHFLDLMDKARSPLDGKYFVHLFSFILNLSFGHALGPTPDGRKNGEPLAYSLSAQQGRDQRGITAMFKSLSKLPHKRAAGASAAIIDIHPDFIQGENGIELLTSLLYSAVNLGVGQLQMNVVSEERLKLALTDLENYGNIPVRVAGYSQIFKLLSNELQEHVIARMKHKK